MSGLQRIKTIAVFVAVQKTFNRTYTLSARLSAYNDPVIAASFVPPPHSNHKKLIEHFEVGDLVYGIAPTRKKFIDDFKTGFPEKAKSLQDPRGKSFIIDDYERTRYRHGFSEASLLSSAERFAGQIEYERYVYTADFSRYLQSIENSEVHSCERDPAYYSYARGDDDLVPLLKKSCKYGMAWNLSRGRSVHFILNNLDLEKVFRKSLEAYTGSELRFVYRNWLVFKPFYDQETLNFYHAEWPDKPFMKVQAPWEAEPGIVGTYAKKQKKDLSEVKPILRDLRVLKSQKKEAANQALQFFKSDLFSRSSFPSALP